MEVINNSLYGLVQTGAVRSGDAKSSVNENCDTGRSDFRKLLEEKNAADKGGNAGSQTPETVVSDEKCESALKSDETGSAPDEMQDELQGEMACALIAALVDPVIETEQVEQVTNVIDISVFETMRSEHVSASASSVLESENMIKSDAAEETGKGVKDVSDDSGKTRTEAQSTQQVKRADAPVSRISSNESGNSKNEAQSETPDDNAEVSFETPLFRDVTSIPVKVGEVEQTSGEMKLSASAESQITEQITTAVKNGETKVEIRLDPESLGKVKVEMTWSKEGVLRVTMTAESSHTQKLLERGIADLQSMLSRANEQEVSVEMGRRNEGQEQNGHDENRGGEQHENKQEEQKKRTRHDGPEFIQQLRLGLIQLDGEAS